MKVIENLRKGVYNSAIVCVLYTSVGLMMGGLYITDLPDKPSEVGELKRLSESRGKLVEFVNAYDSFGINNPQIRKEIELALRELDKNIKKLNYNNNVKNYQTIHNRNGYKGAAITLTGGLIIAGISYRSRKK